MLVLESGPYVDHTGYPTDPLEAMPLFYRDGGMTIATGKPAIPVPVGRTVGGTTVINSGTCFRAPREVLEEWRDREGVGWATELDPLYEEAEEVLAVTPLDIETLGPQRTALCGGRAGPRRERRPDQPQRGPLRAVQLLPARLPHRREAGRACLLSPRVPWPRALGCAPASRSSASSARTAASVGLACRAGLPTTGRQEMQPQWPPRGRAATGRSGPRP